MEAKIISCFESTHIVQLLGVGEKSMEKEDSQLFMVMELMELGSLRMFLLLSRDSVGNGKEVSLRVNQKGVRIRKCN